MYASVVDDQPKHDPLPCRSTATTDARRFVDSRPWFQPLFPLAPVGHGAPRLQRTTDRNDAQFRDDPTEGIASSTVDRSRVTSSAGHVGLRCKSGGR